MGTVRRFVCKAAARDTPVIRRKAPRNVSVIFMICFCLCCAGALAREK